MACHELAALRLGLMRVIGIQDEVAEQHEIAEIGDALKEAGPIKCMAEAKSLIALRKFYEDSLSDLEKMVSKTAPDDPQLPYYRSLVILTKNVELSLRQQIHALETLFQDLDEIHDFVHEIYPAGK
jgi:hypothetical protein